jgi:hypothetical protein
MSPFASNTIPEPRPVVVSMTTTDGLMTPTTRVKSFCRAPAIAGDAGVEPPALAAGPADEPAPVPQAATRRAPPSRSVPRRIGALLRGRGVFSVDAADAWLMSVPPFERPVSAFHLSRI